METLITNGVKISVTNYYLDEHSSPADGKVFFSYKIEIQNLNSFTIQLLSRYWLIEDSSGMKRIVEGPGVIGKQPILSPNQIHEYSSYCDLNTSVGRMSGYFNMVNLSNDATFQVEVPEFDMNAPFILN